MSHISDNLRALADWLDDYDKWRATASPHPNAADLRAAADQMEADARRIEEQRATLLRVAERVLAVAFEVARGVEWYRETDYFEGRRHAALAVRAINLRALLDAEVK